MALLRECGCQVAQGFLFATALPAHEVEEWLLRQPEFGEVRARAETG
jgi:EAL domain-containing protein (putative c-di-GMP-specific phosphodiesterase class I)